MSAAPKFTPGPWTAVIRTTDNYVHADHNNLIPVGILKYAADARLIAAAPDLYAALLTIANYNPTQWDAATLGNIARAALAKVES